MKRIGEYLAGDMRAIRRAQRVLEENSPKGYYPTKGLRLDLIGVLAAIAKYQHRKFTGNGKRWGKFTPHDRNRPQVWTIVRHEAILAWYFTWLLTIGHGFTLCRRSLKYQLAGLRAAGFIKSEKRHRYNSARTLKLDLRPSVISLTAKGRGWLKNNASILDNPMARLAGQNFAQSGFNPADVYVEAKGKSRSPAKAGSPAPSAPTKKTAAPPAAESMARIRAMLAPHLKKR